MQGSDFGYVVYGSGLFTSEKMIAERSDVVQRFVNAYVQAFADVIKNPDEAADLTIKENPGICAEEGRSGCPDRCRHQAHVLQQRYAGKRHWLDGRRHLAENRQDAGRARRLEA